MRRSFVLGIVAGFPLLIAAGCLGTSSDQTAVTPTPPAAEQPATPPETTATTTPAATAVSADSVAAKLTAAGITFTQQEDDLTKLKTGMYANKSTRFKFSDGDGSVRLTVIELKDVSHSDDVKAEIDDQFKQVVQLAPDMTRDMLDLHDPNAIVMAAYKSSDKAVAQKVEDAVTK